MENKDEMAMGQNPKARTPSEHPKPTTKLGSKMGGAPKTPKWSPIGLTHSQLADQFLGVILSSETNEQSFMENAQLPGVVEGKPNGCGCQNDFGIPFWGAPPILGPILVVGLGCSLG